jgi:hypothetical protein
MENGKDMFLKKCWYMASHPGRSWLKVWTYFVSEYSGFLDCDAAALLGG